MWEEKPSSAKSVHFDDANAGEWELPPIDLASQRAQAEQQAKAAGQAKQDGMTTSTHGDPMPARTHQVPREQQTASPQTISGA